LFWLQKQVEKPTPNPVDDLPIQPLANSMSELITIQTTVAVSPQKAWKYWTTPEHITKWNFASPDWECVDAKSDLYPGGKFSSRMQAKDGSGGFEFGGLYTSIDEYEKLAFEMDDGRRVEVLFESNDGNTTTITESFQPETENPTDFQRQGWQAILDNFKNYAKSM
jgi:uncharacterized protein YndB with AHSA1/START domain